MTPKSRKIHDTQQELLVVRSELQRHESTLDSLSVHTEWLSKALECSICVGHFVQPHTVQCGHSFCMDCIYKWLLVKKTCPACRTAIHTRPIPTLALTSIVDRVMDAMRTTGHDVEQKKSERVFQQGEHDIWTALFGPVTANGIVDEEDDVVRCPYCTWEIDHGVCVNCQAEFGELMESSGEEDEEEEEEGDLSSFVVPDEDTIEYDDSDEDTEEEESMVLPRARHRTRAVNLTSSEGTAPNHSIHLDSDSDTILPVRVISRRRVYDSDDS